MNKVNIPSPARTLLDILNHKQSGNQPTDMEIDTAMKAFLAEIVELDLKHNKSKILSQGQLAEQVFRRNPVFKKDKHAVPYLRYQLRVASEELTQIEQDICQNGDGTITYAAFSAYKCLLMDYLFDLREILVPLQQNVAGWAFFDGSKNSDVTSWEVFLLARGLALQSTFTGTGSYFDHKTAQIASIVVLRQAMELRFERLIAVYPHNPKGDAPRLRHGFHHDFIVKHPQFFTEDDFSIKKLWHLYAWSSEIVHQAYQPYAWQIAMAMRHASDLLGSRSTPSGKAWSIFNAVTISDVDAMQMAYEEHFLDNYGHGTWKFTRGKPEALLSSGHSNQVVTDSNFRQVKNSPTIRGRIKRCISQMTST